MIDKNLEGVGRHDAAEALKRIEEYDVECSMIKVWCSEMLDYVVDETVQIYGGAGYVEDYPAERYWRDARVNRIFEGTNEINRLLVPGRLLRRAMKGELPVFQKAMALMDEFTAGPSAAEPEEGFLAAEARMVAGAKKVALMCLGLAAQKYGHSSSSSRRSSATSRTSPWTPTPWRARCSARRSAPARAGEARPAPGGGRACFAQDAMDRIEANGPALLAALDEGDTLRTYLAALKRFTKREVVNTVALRRQIADAINEAGGYPLSEPRGKSPFGRAAALLYLATLFLLPWSTFPAFPWLHPRAQWSDAVFAGAALLWVVERARERSWPRCGTAEIGMLVYLAMAVLSLLQADPRPAIGHWPSCSGWSCSVCWPWSPPTSSRGLECASLRGRS